MSPEISSESSEHLRIFQISAGQPPYQIDAEVVGLGGEWHISAQQGKNGGPGLPLILPIPVTGTSRQAGQAGSFEDQVAHETAQTLSILLEAPVTVSLSLGLDRVSAREAERLQASLRRLVREIVVLLKSS